VPYQSMLLEMTPDTNERTNLSSVRAYFQQGSSLLLGQLWFLITLPVFFTAFGKPDSLFGARVVLGIMGIVVLCLGILPALFLPGTLLRGRRKAGEGLPHQQLQAHVSKPSVPTAGGIRAGLHCRVAVCLRPFQFRPLLSGRAGQRGARCQDHQAWTGCSPPPAPSPGCHSRSGSPITRASPPR